MYEGKFEGLQFLCTGENEIKSAGIVILNRAYVVRNKLQDSVLGKYRDNQLHSGRRIMVNER
jgi:hypothetical protein